MFLEEFGAVFPAAVKSLSSPLKVDCLDMA